MRVAPAAGGAGGEDVRTYTATLAFVPSEFQAIRIDGSTAISARQ